MSFHDELKELITTSGGALAAGYSQRVVDLLLALADELEIPDGEEAHDHAISTITGLQAALDGKAASSHDHAIANVTGLQTALDGKAATSHDHAIANITGLQTALDEPPHFVGSEVATSLIVTLSGGLWTDDRGWLWLPPTGQSIGDVGSGADVENAKVENLFLALWPHLGAGTAGYSLSGGAGASAQADWDAGKALTIPDYRGRGRLQSGQGASLTNRALGALFGAETHTLILEETPEHTHTVGIGIDAVDAGADTNQYWLDGPNSRNTEPYTTTSAGSGGHHNNMQPSVGINILWFLGERA